MTDLNFEKYKIGQVNILAATNNLIDLSGLNGPADISIVIVADNINVITSIVSGLTSTFGSGTTRAWTIPALVDGVAIINVANFTDNYIWFVGGASADTTRGMVTIFSMDRKPPANNIPIVSLTP
jgi:hypothetical protein